MTDLDPALIVKQFRDRLPPRAQHQLRNTGRIAALIHRAVFGHGPSAGMTCREMHGLVEDADGRPIRKCTCRTPPESDS
jgi:hypothetical protein